MNRLWLVGALMVGTAAWADLVASDEYVCREKKVGEPCSGDQGAGTCQQTTCGRNDYSQGIPPRRKSVPCMKCLPGAAKPAKSATPDAGAPRAPAPQAAEPTPDAGTVTPPPAKPSDAGPQPADQAPGTFVPSKKTSIAKPRR